MKFVILLSLVALCYSLPAPSVPGKTINISDDGTITITTADGKKVVISKAIGATDRFIDVSVEGPNTIPKRIQIDSQSTGKAVNIASGDDQYAAQYDYYADLKEREKRSPKVPAPVPAANKTQGEILSEVFVEYQGVVDDSSYIKLLAKVSDYVDAGKLDASIYDVLAYLNDQRQQEEQEKMGATANPTKSLRQAMWQSWILNYLKSRSTPQNPELSGNPQQPWAQQPAGQPWAQQPAGQPWAQQPAGQPWAQQPAGQPWAQQPAGQPWAQQPAGQPWAQQSAGQPWAQQPAGQPWTQQPAGQWVQQPSGQWVQQPAGQQWAQQPVGQSAQQTVGQQWPADQWAAVQNQAQVTDQQAAAQQPIAQQPSAQPTTGRAVVPLQGAPAPGLLSGQFLQPTIWQQPAQVPVGLGGQVYQPMYQPIPIGYKPGFPWMQFYWNRVIAQQANATSTTPAPDAKV